MADDKADVVTDEIKEIKEQEQQNTEPAPTSPGAPVWFYFELPFRPACGTYDPYDWVPPLPAAVLASFAHLKTLADVATFDAGSSPTGCRVDVDFVDHTFYVDSQGLAAWAFEPDIGVYLFRNQMKQKNVVAKSIAEFFGRITLENHLWRKTHSFLRLYRFEHKTPLHSPTQEELDQVLKLMTVETELDAHAIEYVKALFAHFSTHWTEFEHTRKLFWAVFSLGQKQMINAMRSK